MPKKLFSELGVSGTKHSFGTIDEEYIRDLKGYKAIQVYKEMSTNDSIVGASLLAVDLLIRQVPIVVKAADEDKESQDKAIFLEQCWNDMSFSAKDFMSEAMSICVYGWAYFEEVYKKREGYKEDGASSKYSDGKIGWRKIALRPQDTLYKWMFDVDGGIAGMVQQDPNTYDIYQIPIQKSLLFRTTVQKNNPEGKSLLRNAYRSWYFRKNIENFEAIGIERDLVGLPMARVPSRLFRDDATNEERASLSAIENVLRNIRQDEMAYICLPSDTDEKGTRLYDFELIGSAGNKTFDTDKIIMRKAREITMSVLADFLMLGHEKVGTQALSEDKTDLFYNAIKTLIEQVTSVLNQYAVPRLFRLNGEKLENLPEFTFGEIKSVNLDILSRYLQSLTMAGMQLFPDEELEKYLRQLANLPKSEVME